MNHEFPSSSATAFAPATCANVAVGFDVLGFALQNVGDQVTLTKREDDKICIETIESKDPFPLDPAKNTASAVIQKLLADLKLKQGFSISIQKGIPLSSGMGGSAASAVAALLACNALLEKPLTLEQLVPYALFGEKVSGSEHADNIVPCLYGGLTLIQSSDPLKIIRLPIPLLHCVLVHPHLQVATADARKLLKQEVPLRLFVKQSANLAAFIAALYQKDLELLSHSLTDILIEPQRAGLVPGFYEVKQAALDQGALGVSFSGSGPSLFALAKEVKEAEVIGKAMQAAFEKQKLASDCWISPISHEGARLLCIS